MPDPGVYADCRGQLVTEQLVAHRNKVGVCNKRTEFMLNLVNLDDLTRKWMLSELASDIIDDSLYLSRRLTQRGISDYPSLLKEAITCHDDAWLAFELHQQSRLVAKGGVPRGTGSFPRSVPHNAAETLAEGEFNRFYMRGLACRVLAQGGGHLIVYRAKNVTSPRPTSIALIGTLIDAQALLTDLRTYIGYSTGTGIPVGPNSGLSVQLPGSGQQVASCQSQASDDPAP